MTGSNQEASEASAPRPSHLNVLPLVAAFGCGVAVATFGSAAMAALLGSGGGIAGSEMGSSYRSGNAAATGGKMTREMPPAVPTTGHFQTVRQLRKDDEATPKSTTCPADFSRDSGTVSSPWDQLRDAERRIAERALIYEFSLGRGHVRKVDADVPDKQETLAFLDHGGPLPGRYVRAWVIHPPRKDGDSAYVMEYKVGPIDLKKYTHGKIQPLTKPGSIPARHLGITSRYSVSPIIRDFTNQGPVRSFLIEAFGSTSIEWMPHQNERHAGAPLYADISYRRRSSQLTNELSHSLPFEFRVDMENWRIINILYRNQYFATSAEFVEALESGDVEIVPTAPFTPNPTWQTLDRRSSSRPGNDAPPAVNVQAAKRYTVSGGRVEWLGWSFHVVNRPRTSMAIHDVRFMDDRIAYEMSLQELQAVYTGRQPYMANKYLFDSNFQLGLPERQPRPGVDCPTQATYFDNMCVFELDEGVPLWRKDKLSLFSRSYTGAKSTLLVVRAIYPVGNYDYMVEAKFGLDGSVDMGFAATGQLYMSFYDETEESFGTRVHDEALANLHTHFAAFKVDLDILGQENCVEKTEVKYGPRGDIPGTERDHPDLHVPEKNMYISRDFVKNEAGGRVKVNSQAPAQWKVASCDEKNRWGYHRGYDIVHPNTPLGMGDEISFNDYHMVFARRKGGREEYLTTPADYLLINEPVLPVMRVNGTTAKRTGTSTGGISNGESLIRADVVTWITLGFYHVPRAEDNPVTNLVSSYFRLQPSNYFDENPSIDLDQTVRIEKSGFRGSEKRGDIPKGNCTVTV